MEVELPVLVDGINVLSDDEARVCVEVKCSETQQQHVLGVEQVAVVDSLEAEDGVSATTNRDESDRRHSPQRPGVQLEDARIKRGLGAPERFGELIVQLHELTRAGLVAGSVGQNLRPVL